MAIDLKKIAQKKAEEAAKKNKTFDKIRHLTLKSGENRLRLMPPWTSEGLNADQFWIETYTHWSIGEGGYQEEGGRRFTCPIKTPGGPGGTCEVCELNQSLKNSDDPGDVEIGKQIYAKRRFQSNVVNLKDPVFTEKDVDEWTESHPEATEPVPFEVGDTKVQVWGYPATIYKDLLDIFSDGIDLTSFEEGQDVIVTKEGAGLSTQYRVRLNPKPTPFEFTGDQEKIMYNLDNLVQFAAPGDMAKALAGELQARPAPTLPPPKAAPALPAAKKPTAKAPATKPVATVEAAADDEDEGPPACFKDPTVHSSTDVQCVGGQDDEGNQYDACPHFEPCAEAVAALVAAPTRRKPAPAKAPQKSAEKSTTASNVAAMEARLKAALKG